MNHFAVLVLYPVPRHSAPPCSPVLSPVPSHSAPSCSPVPISCIKSQCTILQSCYSIPYQVTVYHSAVLLLYPVPSHSAPTCSPVLSPVPSYSAPSCSPVTLSCTKTQCTTLQSCYSILHQDTVHHLTVLLLYPAPRHSAPPCSPVLSPVPSYSAPSCSPVTLSCTKPQCTHHLAVLLLYPAPSHSAPSCSPVPLSCTKNTAAHKLKLAQCLLLLEQWRCAVSQDKCSHIRHLIWVTRSARIFTFTDANLDRTNRHRRGINGLGPRSTDASVSTVCALGIVCLHRFLVVSHSDTSG